MVGQAHLMARPMLLPGKPRIVKPLADEYWGARAFTVSDLNGYHLTFAEQTEALTPEQMVERLRERG